MGYEKSLARLWVWRDLANGPVFPDVRSSTLNRVANMGRISASVCPMGGR